MKLYKKIITSLFVATGMTFALQAAAHESPEATLNSTATRKGLVATSGAALIRAVKDRDAKAIFVILTPLTKAEQIAAMNHGDEEGGKTAVMHAFELHPFGIDLRVKMEQASVIMALLGYLHDAQHNAAVFNATDNRGRTALERALDLPRNRAVINIINHNGLAYASEDLRARLEVFIRTQPRPIQREIREAMAEAAREYRPDGTFAHAPTADATEGHGLAPAAETDDVAENNSCPRICAIM